MEDGADYKTAFRELKEQVEVFDTSPTDQHFLSVIDKARTFIRKVDNFWSKRHKDIKEERKICFINRNAQMNSLLQENRNCLRLLMKDATTLLSTTSFRTNVKKMENNKQQLRKGVINDIFELAKKFLASSIEIEASGVVGKENRTKPPGYSFGRISAKFNIDKEFIEIIDKSKEFCFDVYLLKSWMYRDLEGLMQYRNGSIETLITIANTEGNPCSSPAIKLKGLDVAKQPKTSDAGRLRRTDSLQPEFDKKGNVLTWLNCKAAEHPIKDFKEDGRGYLNRKREASTTDETTKVAKRYFYLVFCIKVADVEFEYSREEKMPINDLYTYFLSPKIVLETHTQQAVESEGYYLWDCVFGNFEQEQTVECIVDKLMTPRYRAVLQKAAAEDEVPQMAAAEVCFIVSKQTRDSMIEAVGDFAKKLNSYKDKEMLNADNFVSDVINESGNNGTKIWNWFCSICDAINLTNSGRENTKDSVIKQELFGRLILDGFHFGILSRKWAEHLLHDSEDGTFLLRFSPSRANAANSLTFKANGNYRHMNFNVKPKDASIVLRISNYFEDNNNCCVLKSQAVIAHSPDIQTMRCPFSDLMRYFPNSRDREPRTYSENEYDQEESLRDLAAQLSLNASAVSTPFSSVSASTQGGPISPMLSMDQGSPFMGSSVPSEGESNLDPDVFLSPINYEEQVLNNFEQFSSDQQHLLPPIDSSFLVPPGNM